MSSKIILENKIPNSKTIYIGLTSIYGIRKSKSFFILKKLGFSKSLKVLELTNNQIIEIQQLVKKSKFKINLNLKIYKKQLLKNKIIRLKKL